MSSIDLETERKLIELKKKLHEEKVSTPPVYKLLETDRYYSTNRNGIVSKVYLLDVKKDKVILKRDKEAVDSYTESRARFEKFYSVCK